MHGRKALFFIFGSCAMIFILSTPAHSSDWLQVESSTAGEKNYLDLSSVRARGNMLTFWSKNLDSKGETTITRFSINCENGVGAIREIVFYRDDNTIANSYKDKKLTWGRITPGSFLDPFQKLLCKERVMP